jgi:hypothetical protein
MNNSHIEKNGTTYSQYVNWTSSDYFSRLKSISLCVQGLMAKNPVCVNMK